MAQATGAQAYPVRFRSLSVSESTIALITVPIVTGVIGYTTNWTGVLMLFYPVHFRGIRAQWLHRIARLLPYKIRQIPGIMIGGLGWQGIVPSRAAKMGSLAVDSGIAKLGTPREFFKQLDPEKIAEQLVVSTRDDLPEIVDRVMRREHPQLWNDLPPRLRALGIERVQRQLPDIVRSLTDQIADHIDQLVDVKLMVIKRFDPELANRVFLEMGRRELKFIQNFGFVFGFLLGIPVAALTHFVTFWWLLPLLGVAIGYVTNWVALWMIYEPAESVIGTLTDPEFSRTQSDTMRKLIAERMREMAPGDFAEMLRTATREDEWLLLLHGAVLGFAGGLLHLAFFG